MAGQSTDRQPLAHSSSRAQDRPDPYARHVEAVRQEAVKRAKNMLSYASKPQPGLLQAIESAATFHDLGKTDPDIQDILRNRPGSPLKWDHVDAGIAHLQSRQDWMAAWLVRGHHAPGLPQYAEHFTEKTDRRLRGRRRDEADKQRHDEQIARTDSMMKDYLAAHEGAVAPQIIQKQRPMHGLTMRLALSCLVDADHTDTASFDSGHPPQPVANTRWDERLAALCAYVRSLPVGYSDAERSRNLQRMQFFDACLNSSITDSVVACEGSVGLGKTTAVAAYLLRRARDHRLRRLIIVAPFTNILTQTAERLRRALVLPGENAEQVIVEHHHRADFSDPADRELAVLWQAPVVLTTAVAFFETLAGCDPATLRKLHVVPGSAIFLDEAHAALPAKLWPQNWRWVTELAHDWGCLFVLASGSLARFWEHSDIVGNSVKLPELLPQEQAAQVMSDEHHRVQYREAQGGRVLSIPKLMNLVGSETGPRLIILNTVQNAAVVADSFRKSGMDVLHISTALTPHDRSLILERIEERLSNRHSPDWTLVATSCIEAGVDLSFRCAFRERFAVASIIQTGGRVNRHGEHTQYGSGIVYDFALAGEGITQHPAANISSDVLRVLISTGFLNKANPADAVTQAMAQEIRQRGGLPADMLAKAESERDYPKVADLARVISADTRLVVIDPHVRLLLTKHQQVDFRSLLQGSVQIWARKIERLALEPLSRGGRASGLAVYDWKYEYDPDFLGYMLGVLKLNEFLAAGGAII